MSGVQTGRTRPTSKRDVIRLAAIGLGERSAWMLRLMAEAEPGVRLDVIVDPAGDEARKRLGESEIPTAETIAEFEDVDTFVAGAADVDAIVLGTRCLLHTPIAVKLAPMGLPLFIEKPVAISWAQLAAVRAAYPPPRDEQVVVSFPLRRTPLFEAVSEVVRGGRTGVINQIQAVNYVTYGDVYVDSWYRDYELCGGLWLQKATHDFDYLHHLANARPLWVTAMHSQCVWRAPVLHQDAGSAIVQYDSGAHAAYSQNFITRRAAGGRGATITGEDGTLTFDWVSRKLRFVDHTSDRVEEREVVAEGEHHGGDEALARNFLDVVYGRSASLTPLSDGLLSAATCLAARDAAHSRTVEPIPPQTEVHTNAPAPIVDTTLIEPPFDTPV
ncbi:MAG: Gfo/Idh/MocA family oxidoreductase [bacterium]|nr:Gfo/Idh/MocA family oxidoreductase [bacterium]